MIVVYPIGVVGLYFYFLYHNRDAIMAMKAEEEAEKKRRKAEREEGGGHHGGSGGHGGSGSDDHGDEDVDKAADIGTHHQHHHTSHDGSDKRTHTDAAAAAAHAHGLAAAADAADIAARSLYERDDNKKLDGDGDGHVDGDKDKHGPIVGPAELTFLYRAYEGRVWYWEVVETTRRLLLTAVVSVVGTGSAAQVVFGIVVAIVYVKLYGHYQPYELDEHDVMQEVAQYQVFVTLFIALLIRGDLLQGAAWARTLDVMLFVANLTTATASLVFYFKLHELEATRARWTVMERLHRLVGRSPHTPPAAGAAAATAAAAGQNEEGQGAGEHHQQHQQRQRQGAQEGRRDEEEGAHAGHASHPLRLQRPDSIKDAVPAARSPSLPTLSGRTKVYVDVEGKGELDTAGPAASTPHTPLLLDAPAEWRVTAPVDDDDRPLAHLNPVVKKRRIHERSSLSPLHASSRTVLPAPLPPIAATRPAVLLPSAGTDVGAGAAGAASEAKDQ